MEGAMALMCGRSRTRRRGRQEVRAAQVAALQRRLRGRMLLARRRGARTMKERCRAALQLLRTPMQQPAARLLVQAAHPQLRLAAAHRQEQLALRQQQGRRRWARAWVTQSLQLAAATWQQLQPQRLQALWRDRVQPAWCLLTRSSRVLLAAPLRPRSSMAQRGSLKWRRWV